MLLAQCGWVTTESQAELETNTGGHSDNSQLIEVKFMPVLFLKICILNWQWGTGMSRCPLFIFSPSQDGTEPSSFKELSKNSPCFSTFKTIFLLELTFNFDFPRNLNIMYLKSTG